MGCKKISIWAQEKPTLKVVYGARLWAKKRGAGRYYFGFNSKEKDTEGEWGTQTHYDYGFRIYEPGIGRFLSVDPLMEEYPFYTPYQFAGNMPTKFIDLDGLEPSQNPENPEKQDGRDPTFAPKVVFSGSGGIQVFNNILMRVLEGSTEVGTGSIGYVSDVDISTANTYNMFVNGFQETLLSDIELTDKEVINFILGTMLTGLGPENIVFPTDGFVSQRIKTSPILFEGIKAWAKFNEKALKSRDVKNLQSYSSRQSFGLHDLQMDFDDNLTLYTIPGLVGSAKVTIIPKSDHILVEVFNITNITSGDYHKHIPGNIWPKSVVRERYNNTPYGNVSQKYSITLPYDFDSPLGVNYLKALRK